MKTILLIIALILLLILILLLVCALYGAHMVEKSMDDWIEDRVKRGR